MAEQQASFFVQMHDGVTASARRMRAAIRGLRGEMGALKRDSAGRFLKTKGTGLSGMGDAISDMHKRWEKFQKSPAFGAIQSGLGRIKEGLLVGAAIAAGTAAAIGTVGVKFADFSQRAATGFKAVAQHGENAERLFTHTQMLAEGLGLDVLDTTKQFTKFMALQFSPKMATDLIKMSADLQGIGASMEQVGSVMNAVGKIQSQGKMQGDEVMMFAEAGVSAGLVYDALAKKLGKTKDEILSMQQAGKLTSDLAIPAILEAVGKKTGGRAGGALGQEIANSTIGGIANVMKAKAQNAFIDIGQRATPAIMSALKPVSAMLGDLFKSEGFRSGFASAVENIAMVVREAVPFVKAFVGSLVDGFQEAWPAIQGALGVLFDGFGGKQDWMENVKQFGRTLGKVTALAVGLATVVGGSLVAGLELASKAIETVMFFGEGLVTAIGKAIFTISDFFANLAAKWEAFDFGALAQSLIDGLVLGISNGMSAVWDAVTGLGTTIIQALKSALGIASPSKPATAIGMNIGDSIEGGFIRSMRAANDNMGRVASDIVPAIEGPVAASVAQAPELGGASMGAGGGMSQVNYFDITIVQQPGQDAQELADEIERRIRRGVDSRLEEFAVMVA